MTTVVETVKLNLGSHNTRIPGFLSVDIREDRKPDIVANVDDLSKFTDGAIDEIYASNILEHFPHTKTVSVLKEWNRVLKPGGKLFVSVPNFDVAIEIYFRCQKALDPWIVNLLYGDQKDTQEFHYTPFNWANLRLVLDKAGFSQVKRLEHLPYKLNDCSELRDSLYGLMVCLNAEAVK